MASFAEIHIFTTPRLFFFVFFSFFGQLFAVNLDNYYNERAQDYVILAIL